MLDKLLFVVTQKLAVLFVGGLSVAGGLLTMGTAHIATLPQTAVIANVAGSTADTTSPPAAFSASSSVPAAAALPIISLGMLPTTTIPFCPTDSTSTCGRKNLQALIRISASLNKVSLVTTTTAVTVKKTVLVVAPAAITATAAATLQPIIPQAITAQLFLADTTSSLKVLLDGMYEVTFITSLGGGQPPLTWGLLATTVGGTGSVPAFSVTSSCDPAPLPATPNAIDKNPTFTVRTSYDCSVSLTPTSGTNQVTQSKDFSFTTPPGQLVVMNDSSMNTLLANDTNDGGIVFNNQDTNPVTITGVTFDASYSYLSTLNGPLVLRFLNPATQASLVDYHLEKLPADPNATNTYSYGQSNITLPFSFTIPAATQKMLPIEVLGVDRMFVLGTTPTVSITLQGVTTDQSDVKTVMVNPNVTWSCSVSTASYDPNATSGVYATGQACLN